jgi:CRISPR/Cas system-associated protein Cas7 (RAMP superfamily)
MYISEGQIETVVKILKDNEYRLSDGYKFYYIYNKEGGSCFDEMEDEEIRDLSLESVLWEIAVEIIENLNKTIYKGT